jgi:hypothetical protein
MLPGRIEERIHPEPNTGCWLWDGSGPDGYGSAWWGGKLHRAHRLVYEMAVGPIPKGLGLDHTCRVRCCVNPAHLEPVTQRENIRRSPLMAGKSECKHGHTFTPENTIWRKNGTRKCRACHNAST